MKEERQEKFAGMDVCERRISGVEGQQPCLCLGLTDILTAGASVPREGCTAPAYGHEIIPPGGWRCVEDERRQETAQRITVPGDVPIGRDRDNICGPFVTALAEVQVALV
ncbi:unnamed protein product [Pleuronectes platessa]|uniref:Uncharacterized protein n=1 Tax=Pleuronectes platessa TaxID=8262 RepID=A0A9N7TYN8_PLEPL|nr:unnamed protein product [Pleuronectes platessa]